MKSATYILLHSAMVKAEKGPETGPLVPLSGGFSTAFSAPGVEDSVVAFCHMARERILLIEDEPDIAEVLQYNLEKEGFDVDLAHRGDSGLEALRRHAPDLILLDLMLPGVDGLELTRLLKRDAGTSRIPIVMLTARGEEVDRIVGLELGADDYISKPFSPREVVLRVKAVLRRRRPEPAAASGSDRQPDLTVGGIRLDIAGHQLRIGSEEIPLTATEFRLLRLLLERAGRVQT